ncbi:MAG: DUF4255 domain-containing protein [Bacteroidota bacterium]
MEIIHTALTLIQAELDQYVQRQLQQPADTVVLGNVAMIESEGNNVDLLNKAIITLVNIEEESTLKNVPHHRITNGSVRYENPPVVLNLYILVSANFPTRYGDSLELISTTLEFFQGQNHFTPFNSPSFSANFPDLNTPEIASLRLNVDLYTMTFEQLNHLWGSLGGKQIPFLMYKVRMLRVMADNLIQDTGTISEVVTNNRAT